MDLWCSRPAWSTNWVSGQPGLERETLSWNKSQHNASINVLVLCLCHSNHKFQMGTFLQPGSKIRPWKWWCSHSTTWHCNPEVCYNGITCRNLQMTPTILGHVHKNLKIIGGCVLWYFWKQGVVINTSNYSTQKAEMREFWIQDYPELHSKTFSPKQEFLNIVTSE